MPVTVAGKVSTMLALMTELGPALLIVMVYRTKPPAATTVTPSFFVIDKLATPRIVSVSVALLLVGFGSLTVAGAATVAVLINAPLALFDTLLIVVNVTTPPTAKLTIRLMLPKPPAPLQLDPGDGVHPQTLIPSAAGKMSVTCAPVTGAGPELLTRMM